MDELRAISTFVRAAELGSFNQVAIAQGMTPQAVSKAVRQLERHLGVRLFHRTTRRSSLTEDGRRFLEAVKPSLEGMLDALSRIRRTAQDDEGLIRVTAPRPIGRRVLLPLIEEFRQSYPKVEIELLLDERITDIVAERIDIGFRGGAAPEGQLIVRHLFALQLIPCAAPAYLARHGCPATLDDLARHHCTGFRMPSTGRLMPWEFTRGAEIVYRDIPAVFCTNDPQAELEAVIAGFGVGQLDGASAAEPIRAGRLVPLLCEHVSERMGIHIYYPQRADMPKRVRSFIDFAVGRLLNTTRFHLSIEELETHRRAFLARQTRVRAA
ncbi:MAG: LysR family transcriptional regulator [Candidatus Methylophosphatis roskildensis]